MTLLQDPERHPLLPPSSVRDLGATVVLAPHPDDESLGCGGLLALLAREGVPARVVVVTDGRRSHPGSASYPAPRLAALREVEARRAVAALGLADDAIAFLRHPDCGLPQPGTDRFDQAARDLSAAIGDARTVVVPWRRDPHCDHEATWALARAAVRTLDPAPRWIEYPVWAWTRAEAAEAPRPDEARAWRLNVAPVLDRKRAAVAAHRSQTTALIDDDPGGFQLAPDVLDRFDRVWELYLDPLDADA